ncbi:hypothetical protein KSS87_002141 [Heliosperma pusillum]|nr:hypothetical protein KSS87_002141 [Heliosperma pusillum]
MEAIYLIGQENYRDKKDLDMVFIGLGMACDRVPRQVLWWTLTKKEVSQKYVNLVIWEPLRDHLALMMELLGMMPRKIALGGRYSRDFFNRYGDLRHIRRLRFWPLNKVLVEKYEFNEQDANELAEFLAPILDFVPEKRPTAGQCLSHPWIAMGPHRLVPTPAALSQPVDVAAREKKRREKDEREEVEKGMGSIAISADSKTAKQAISSPKPSMALMSSSNPK